LPNLNRHAQEASIWRPFSCPDDGGQARKNDCGKVGAGQGMTPQPESAWAESGPVKRKGGTVCAPGATVRSTQDSAAQGLASRAFRLSAMKKK